MVDEPVRRKIEETRVLRSTGWSITVPSSRPRWPVPDNILGLNSAETPAAATFLAGDDERKPRRKKGT